jgi:competence protein ComEA
VDFLFTTGEKMTRNFNLEGLGNLLRAGAVALTVLVSTSGVAYASPINVNTGS